MNILDEPINNAKKTLEKENLTQEEVDAALWH